VPWVLRGIKGISVRQEVSGRKACKDHEGQVAHGGIQAPLDYRGIKVIKVL
jgi:hypothetical protein